MRLAIPGSIVIVAVAMMLAACDSPTVISSANPGARRSPQAGDSASSMARHQPGEVKQAVAVMRPTEGNVARGTVTFTRTEDGVRVVADITGLAPNGKHAIHVHEYGDARGDDGTRAGGHYNPQSHAHDLPGNAPRHAGDLGNLTADYNGNAHYEITVDNITLDGDVNPILGRGVIIHAGADDGGQPTGNAGARISIGVIGVASP